MSTRHALFVIAAAHAGHAAAAPVGSSSLHMGVVVAPDAHTVYLMDTTGVAAVELATGKPRWTSSTLTVPLARVGGALLAIDDHNALAVVDADTGKPVKRCPKLAKVGTLVGNDALGARTSSEGSSDGRYAWIAWSIDTHYVGGVAATSEVMAAAEHHSSGVWKVDVAACTAIAVDAAPTARVEVGNEHGTTVTHLTGPNQMDVRVVLGQRVIVERKRGGKRLADLDLGVGPLKLVGVDAERRRISVGEYDPKTNAYPTTIYDLETGDSVATGEPSMNPASFAIVGDVMVSWAGQVAAYDLAHHKQLWTRALRSTEYVGSMPPSMPRPAR